MTNSRPWSRTSNGRSAWAKTTSRLGALAFVQRPARHVEDRLVGTGLRGGVGALLGSLIGLEHRKAVRMMRDVSWELLQTVDGELLVPDNFFDLYVVPLSPTACMAAQGVIPGGRLNRQTVTALNRAAVATAWL